MLNDDHLDQLRDAMLDYIDAHGLPTEREALDWFLSAAREGTTPFDAFAPMFDTYASGSGGFTVDEWMNMTYNFSDITISTDVGGGVFVYFDFDFESEDGNYQGSRGGRGHI